MMIKNIFINICLAICLTAACADDTNGSGPNAETYIPEAPDYENPVMWTIYKNDHSAKTADVFYIPSTWEYDWTAPDGRICHYADVWNPKHRDDMEIEITGVAEYMAENNNFYSPFYRHITLDTWATLNEDTITARYSSVSLEDVRNAFRHFLERWNNGRPFILAGFSQGGKSVVELMKTLCPEERERLVAAYVMGYKITPADTVAAPWIKGAVKESDTGVTICYNSVSDVKYVKPIVAAPNVMSINPVNWTTDDTPAILNDTITVTLDPEVKVLVLKGFDGSYLPNILGVLNVGDYHGAEPWIYSDCLKENIGKRIEAYRNKNFE